VPREPNNNEAPQPVNRIPPTAAESLPAPPAPARSLSIRILLHCLLLALATVAFIAYEHFKLAGQSALSIVCLVAAALLAVSPVRALLGEMFSIERRALHVLHGIGGLAFVGLAVGGVVSGAPLLNHAAMAPFALMGAAQAVMHHNHPRNAKQAEALRRFATSLPEIAEFTRAGDLTSPANAARAVRVLDDLISKAEALGETELGADPNFQRAWARTTTHAGLTLGLDSVDQAINRLAKSPTAAAAVPELRRRLAEARRVVSAHS